MSGSVALHVLFAPRLMTGATQTRTIRYLDATTEVSPGSGTYTLYAPDGTEVSGCAGLTVTAGSVSVPVPADLTLGDGYVELWQMASVGGVARTERIGAVMQMWSLGPDALLASGYHFVSRYPHVGSLYAAGSTSWEAQAVLATARVLNDADDRLRSFGAALATRQRLVALAIEALCAEVWRLMASLGNSAAADMEARHEAMYVSMWDRLVVDTDSDGDGVGDTSRTAQAPIGGV